MDPTDLGGSALARPAIALLGSTLCVAWSQASADLALPTINVASGLPPASGQWAPTITPLTLHSPDDVGLAIFKGKLWLGYAGSDSSVHLATSPDGVNFGPGIDYPGPVAAGVSLVGDVERLYVAWTEAGTGKVVIASTANGVAFDTIVKLGIISAYTPALALYKHVFFGPRVCLVWADDTRRLRISSAPRYDLNRLQEAPLLLGQTTRAAPSVYAYSPLYEPEDRLLVGYLDQTGSLPSLVSTNADMTTFSPPDFDAGVNGNSAPSLVYDSGTLRTAYAGPVDWTIKVGDRDRVFRIPDDLRALVDKNQECDPRKCTPDPRLVCIVGNEDRLALVPAQIHNAERGFIVLSPADGTGAIGTILRGTQPIQFYDHMGIMVEDYLTIRHCTESKDRLRDEFYYQGSVLGERVPTDGLRADHVKYGWPGPITQSIDDAFYFGNNAGRNLEWDFYTLNPSEPHVPPPAPGSKDDGTFWKRLAFYDPERPAGNDTGEGYTILNLSLAPAHREDHPDGPVYPQVVRPPRGIEWLIRWIRWLLGRIADQAVKISRGHYRFYAYTRGAAPLDASGHAPPKGDPIWVGLPAGADWASGSPALVCSTFVWYAARNAVRDLSPPVHLGDALGSPDKTAHDQTGMPVFDALYQYSLAERSTSGQALYDWTVESVRAAVKQKVDKAFPSVAARIGIAALIDAALAGPYGLIAFGFSAEVAADLVDVLTKMPEHVGNQICNAFASDAPESISSDAWKSPGIGVSVSPDDVMNYWDAPMDAFGDVRHGPYGAKEEALITRSRIEEVPAGVLRYSAGVARVHGLVTFGGVLLEGADVWIGCRRTTTTPNGFFLVVPASDADNGPQLIRASTYWKDPASGRGYKLSGERRVPLPPGNQEVGAIELGMPPNWRRRVQAHGKLDMVHQVLIGHDTIDHKKFSDTAELQYRADWIGKPGYDDAQSMRDHRKDVTPATDVCGGETAKLFLFISLEDDLRLLVNWTFAMFDEGTWAPIVETSGSFYVPEDGSWTVTADLKDDDTPPDRAHCEFTIDNQRCPA